MEESAEDSPKKAKLTDDKVLLKQVGSLDFYYSKKQHAFIVETSEYHVGSVKVSRPDLVELLQLFDKQAQEIETELLSELDAEDEDGF